MSNRCNYGTIENARAHNELIGDDLSTTKTTYPAKKGRFIPNLLCMGLLISMSMIVIYITGFDFCVGPLNPPYNRKEWGDFRNQSFSVGIDLTIGYGTAVILFENGTTVHVARIAGSESYNSLYIGLTGLEYPNSIPLPPSPPYYSCSDQLFDLKRQWSRYFRKRAGHPASYQVATFIPLIERLKFEVEKMLGDLSPLEKAFITVPHVPRVRLEELIDAGSHLGIQFLTLPPYLHRPGDHAQWPVTELNTAFAGNGLGLENINFVNNSLPNGSVILSVLFTDLALSTFVLSLTSAASYLTSTGQTEFSSGYNLAPPPEYLDCPSPSNLEDCGNIFWRIFRNIIRNTLESHYTYPSPEYSISHVVSYGNAAHDAVFDRVLREEVLKFQRRDGEVRIAPVFVSGEPTFVAARGAALFGGYCARLDRPGDCIPDLRPRQAGQ